VNPPSEVIDALASASRLLVIGHVTPDVDAVGAMFGLARAVPARQAAVVLPGVAVSQRMRFLLELRGDVPLADDEGIREADVAAVVDVANTARVNVPGDWEAIVGKRVVNIDHHITNTDFGTLNWVVDHASSTCELIARLIDAAGWPMDAQTASLLFAGMHADTGGFSLPNASADSFDTAARLVRAGADIESIGARLCRSQESHEFDLLRTVFHNTRVAGDGQIAYSTLTHEEIVAAGCTPENIDDQVSIPRSISGIKVAILFSEGTPGVVRINLRGEEGTAVLPLAQKLGGGGHTFSAGVRIRGEFEHVVERVLDEASRSLS
jgi:phosphoesterase RecJ-like protein